MDRIFNYIESHPQLVTIIIYIVGIGVAWISGLFKAILRLAQKLDNRVRIEINPASAGVTFLKEYESNNKPAKRFAFWLSLKISNPSEKVNTITKFELNFKDKRRRWSKSLMPITFPSVPRQKIGENIKFLPIYFSRFSEFEEIFGKEFTPDGKLEPGESQNGYLLFVEEFFGSWLPSITKKGVQIKVKCTDLRGKVYKVKSWAKSLSTKGAYDFIPGLEKYKEGVEFLSSLHRWESSFGIRSKEGRRIINKMKKLEK